MSSGSQAFLIRSSYFHIEIVYNYIIGSRMKLWNVIHIIHEFCRLSEWGLKPFGQFSGTRFVVHSFACSFRERCGMTEWLGELLNNTWIATRLERTNKWMYKNNGGQLWFPWPTFGYIDGGWVSDISLSTIFPLLSLPQKKKWEYCLIKNKSLLYGLRPTIIPPNS